MGTAIIPESFRDLIDGPFIATLTTVTPDGYPHTTPVWFNRDGDYILINTMRGFRKEKHMRQNPKVTLLAFNPKSPMRNIEIRGTVVEMTEVCAVEHLDCLTQLYLNNPDAKFFGDCVPVEFQETQHPVKIRILPTHVRVEG
jgi:PPOX class probable F420-dependent enzyme